jgi:hypothetical protein
MRLDLRLHGRTATGQKCQADISVYATSAKDLQKQADLAAQTAAWMTTEKPIEPIPEGSEITVEHVEQI